ncbi:MAG TPA: RsmE family RNA methyltransferase [Bryobacteraceae bacterium]|nr:RsmE family RNA methyltransferase [Bryobacteraceae bacterium]
MLRVEAGQKFELSDNRAVYLAEVESLRKDLVSFAILEQLDTPVPAVRTTLFASLIKFDRFEWMLEKATELGVERVVPVEAERSERGLAEAAGKRRSRWKRIMREASEQSRRAHLPEVGSLLSIATALESAADFRLALEEETAPPILTALPARRKPEDRVALLIGPEGGWTDRERQAVAQAGWTAVSLGCHILRAETAGIAGLAILNAAWAAP